LGGSVAVGTLIVGIGLLGVFVIANDAIIAQMETSVEVIEAEDDPSPSIRIRDANLAEDAILSVAITDGGTGYSCTHNPPTTYCTITASGSGGGNDFYAFYAVVGGEIDSLTIQNHGSGYTGTITFTVNNGGTPTLAATLAETIGNAVYVNASNDGIVSIDVDDMWISVEGLEPDPLTSSYNTFGTFFPTEIIPIVYLEGGSSGLISSVTITANGAIATRAGL